MMTDEELGAKTEAARDRMAQEFAAAEQIPVVVLAWHPRTGDVSCSAGGFEPGMLPNFLRMAAANLEAHQAQAQKLAASAGKGN